MQILQEGLTVIKRVAINQRPDKLWAVWIEFYDQDPHPMLFESFSDVLNYLAKSYGGKDETAA
jgi:hypothetical protein